ncbi:lytic transglycosylase domain-containing protein [Actibacterium sp. MT2.3-13A]|uniref:lytic transglycosylase domain-containing protein n=1 Tax=Actibacterium sp. MT2.3-13A TaxID=2828332 RepID=UPI001BA9B1BD|nr:lytic transglycosylase domain-containing protein [Actibacterium sp. MT2.3-13A]
MNSIFKAFLAVLLAGATPAAPETPPPYPNFTFKRVTPPQPGATRRITVQITPGAAQPAAPARLPAAQGGGRYDWYWGLVSPALSESGPGRLGPALTALDSAPEGQQVDAPRLQALQQIAQAHGIEILKATVGTQVSPALVLAVIAVESGGDPAALSGKGAAGLMQLMPATAERFDVTDAADPAQNIRGGVAYLNWLMSEFKRDPVLVLAGYNAGENAVRSHDGVPPFAETRDYVPRVLAAWTVARGLCLTPPELVTDGCVLRVASAG